MSKIGIFCDNVLQGPIVGILHSYMIHHKETEGKWPTLYRCLCVLESKNVATDEWELRLSYFRIKEGES